MYIRKNELAARVLFLHAYMDIDNIPSELEANIKILDEAFPSTTLDLVFIKGTYGPTVCLILLPPLLTLTWSPCSLAGRSR